MDLGDRIKSLRESLGLTQSELARRIGKRPHYISQLEKGVIRPSLGALEHLAEALGLTPSELLKEDVSASRAVSEYEDPEQEEYVMKLVRIFEDMGPDAVSAAKSAIDEIIGETGK